MTYQEFKETTKKVIQNKLGSNVKVTIQEIIKNNDTHLDGLTILSNQLNISPTIYLNYYFKQLEKGKSLSDICDEILATYEENKPESNIDISFFTDYEKVKERIIFKLVNQERNQELLSKVPHIKILDLAVVFNCLLDSDESGSATILIHNHHLTYWNIDKNDLYQIAMLNTPRLLSYDLRNMTDVLSDLLNHPEGDPFDDCDEPVIPMYVLSNKLKLNGSGCILYKDLLRTFSNKIHSDLYILPSSVHEVLIIPAQDLNSFDELSNMVKEVNASQLTREEILSDHVYFYSREKQELTM